MSEDKLASAGDEACASQAGGAVWTESAHGSPTSTAAVSEKAGFGLLAVSHLVVAIVGWVVTAERLYRYGGYVPLTRFASLLTVGFPSVFAILWLWLGKRWIIKKVVDPGYWRFCLALAVALAVSWPVLLFWPRSSTLRFAVARGDIRQAEWCLRLGADPNYKSWSMMLWGGGWSRGTSPVETALEGENAAMVRLLMDRGGSLDLYGEPVLLWAVDRGDTNLVAHLLEKKVVPKLNPTTFGDQPINDERLRAVEAVVAAGLVVRPETLQAAIQTGDVRLVQILLSGRADPNEIPSWGRSESSLCVATRLGNPAVVEVLLRAGADPNVPGGEWSVRERRRLVPLEIAREQENPTLIRLLEQHGATIPQPLECP